MSASWHWTPLHQNLTYWLSPTAALEQSLRAVWDAGSWAAVLILPQIKLNSQLSSCTSFFKLTVMATDKGTLSGLPSFDWTPRGTGALVPAVAPCAHPPPRGVQTNLGKSLLVLKSPILVEILSLIWQWSRLTAPSKEDRYWGREKHLGHTHSWSRHWVGLAERYREIPTQAKAWGAGWKMPELPTQWKGTR